MSLTIEEVQKIAHLARLNLTKDEAEFYAPQISKILDFIEHMNRIDTEGIEPLAHPLELSQRLRDDKVTAKDEREKFQAIAPQVEAGLYLVPKVIDEAS